MVLTQTKFNIYGQKCQNQKCPYYMLSARQGHNNMTDQLVYVPNLLHVIQNTKYQTNLGPILI
jgi:hypothetical protein